MKQFDRIIIGGGAAGMFAAGFAGQRGERVLVLEKRERPARKISMTDGYAEENKTLPEAEQEKKGDEPENKA